MDDGDISMILNLDIIDRYRMLSLLPIGVKDSQMAHAMKATKNMLGFTLDEIREWGLVFSDGKMNWDPALIVSSTRKEYDIHIYVIEAIKTNIGKMFSEGTFQWEFYLDIHDMLFTIDTEQKPSLEYEIEQLKKQLKEHIESTE